MDIEEHWEEVVDGIGPRIERRLDAFGHDDLEAVVTDYGDFGLRVRVIRPKGRGVKPDHITSTAWETVPKVGVRSLAEGVAGQALKELRGAG